MEKLIKKAVNQTLNIAKEFIMKQATEEGHVLILFKKGVRTWYCYVCTNCSTITTFPESEANNYATELGRNTYPAYFEVLCPSCGRTRKVSLDYGDVGIIKFISDKENIVDLKCSIKTYPDTELITSCKLTELSYKDIYKHSDEIPDSLYWNSDKIEDETAWDAVYNNLIDADLKVDAVTYGKLQRFIEDLNITSVKYQIICYLIIKESPNILKVIMECNNYMPMDLLKGLFASFVAACCPKNKVAMLKNTIKKVSLLTEDNISAGDIFTLPFIDVKECNSLEKFDALRRIYSKSKDEEDYRKILGGAAISENIKFLNALRKTLQKIPSFSSEKIANICIMQYVFGGYDYIKTCQMLSRNCDKPLEKVDFFKPNLLLMDWSIKANKYTFLAIRGNNDEAKQTIQRENKILGEVNPEETVIFDDDMYELEKDVMVISDICEKESFYYTAIKDLYRQNIAYLFTNSDKTKYLFARKTGQIMSKGQFA